MNQREKKLIFILFGAAFIIVNLFLFTSFRQAEKKKKILIENNIKELALKKQQILEADERIDEEIWLNDNQPQEGTHSDVRAELVTFAEKSARTNGITAKKRPVPLPENPEASGNFSKAMVKMVVNATDQQLVRWITELQSPKSSRAVTFLRIIPQRDDNTRIDCELEVTQWFIPSSGDESEEITSN